VKALECHIIALSEESLNAIDDIGQYHFPRQLQSVTIGGTSIIYGLPSGTTAWNGLTQKSQNTRLCVNRLWMLESSPNVLQSYVWSKLIADNKPQCVHLDFNPKLAEKSNPKVVNVSHLLLKKE